MSLESVLESCAAVVVTVALPFVMSTALAWSTFDIPINITILLSFAAIKILNLRWDSHFLSTTLMICFLLVLAEPNIDKLLLKITFVLQLLMVLNALKFSTVDTIALISLCCCCVDDAVVEIRSPIRSTISSTFSIDCSFVVVEIGCLGLAVCCVLLNHLESLVKTFINSVNIFQPWFPVTYSLLRGIIVAITFTTTRRLMAGVVQGDPVVWMMNFLGHDSFMRAMVCGFWVASIAIVVPVAARARDIHWPQICTRKIFHALASVMFGPPLLQQELLGFTALAMGVALCALVLLEVLRCYYLKDISQLRAVSQYFETFKDHRCVYAEVEGDEGGGGGGGGGMMWCTCLKSRSSLCR